MVVSTTPAWGMEPTTSSLRAMSPYLQAKTRGAFVVCSSTARARVGNHALPTSAQLKGMGASYMRKNASNCWANHQTFKVKATNVEWLQGD
jgi:hypothetical protein